jgi:hypothetical protein
MVVYNFSCQGSFALDQGVKSWDPSTVFGITNPDTRGFTCVGYAPSCGRRCRNPIAQCNRQKVFDMLDEIALLSPNSRAVTLKLAKIAFLSLCVRNHRGQVEEVVSEWQTRISSMKPHAAEAKSRRVDGDANSLQTSLRNAALRSSRQTPQTHSSQKPTTSAKTSPTSAGEEQRKQGIQEKRRQEQERLRKEKLKKEEEEREREAEKKRRQRASERKQEEEERLKRAKAAKEKKEWEKAWKSYIEGWDIFRGMSLHLTHIRTGIDIRSLRYRIDSRIKYSFRYPLARERWSIQ